MCYSNVENAMRNFTPDQLLQRFEQMPQFSPPPFFVTLLLERLIVLLRKKSINNVFLQRKSDFTIIIITIFLFKLMCNTRGID